MKRSLVVAMLLLIPAAASAQERALPPSVKGLLDCRNLTDPAARLACFDKEAGAIEGAISRKDVVLIDRQGVQRAKRTLFGLSLPKFGVFDDDGEELKQIDGEIVGVGRNEDGGVVLILKDGGRWSQTDDRPIALEPRSGDKVTIKKAALGSYMLSVNRQPSVRVKRVN